MDRPLFVVTSTAAAAAMAMNRQSRGEGRPLLEGEAGATIDASPETRWLAEMLSYSEGLVSSQGLRILTLSYAHPGSKL